MTTELWTLGPTKAKIWQVPTYEIFEHFHPYNGDPVTDITWSNDGYSIACCSSSDTTVHLRKTKDAFSTPSRSFQLQAECLSLDFNSDSRYLLCGCVDGTLHIYDRKSKSISKSYKNQTSPVSSVRWNWNNNNIAVGNKNGEILLYNVVTSQSSRPLIGRSTQAIQQLKYNPYKKAMLVSTCDDGGVTLWDTNTRRFVHNFDKAHQASAKDLAFSPINDIFMVTVGLDKKAVFYDLENKTSIRTIATDHPLTCVDVLQDGTTVAVGTMHGQVFLYDMRKSTAPVFNFTAHKASVKRLFFVHKEPQKGDSTAFSSAHSTSDSLRRNLPKSPAESNRYNESSACSSKDLFSKSDVDIFSPVAQGNKNNNSVPDVDSTGRLDDGAEIDQLAAMYSSEGGAVHGIFSPLKANLSQSLEITGGSYVFADFSSYLKNLLGSAENSLNQNPSHHSIPNYTDRNGDLMPSKPLGNATQSEVEVPLEVSSAKSPRRLQNHHSVTFYDRPSQMPSNHEGSRSSASPGGQNNSFSRVHESAVKHMSEKTAPVAHTVSPPRSIRSQESPRAGDPAPSFLPAAEESSSLTETTMAVAPLSGAEAAASNLSSVTSSLRSFVQELLHEQLQAHQANLQTPTKDSESLAGLIGPESSHRDQGMGLEIRIAELASKLKDLQYGMEDMEDRICTNFRRLMMENLKVKMNLERIEALLKDRIE